MANEDRLFKISGNRVGFGMCSSGSCWSAHVGGYEWRCGYATNSCAGTVSLTLRPSSDIHEPHNARFKLSLLDREGRPVPSRTRACSFQNWSASAQQGWNWTCADFISREDLERPEYLEDGSFTVRCNITLEPFTAKDTGAFVTVPLSDLHQHLGSLLGCKEGADVTFQLLAGGETFPAHRCVLAARSPVFRALLFGEMKESKPTAGGGGGSGVIEIDDVEARVFSSLLRFIYTDSLPETDEEERDDDDDGTMVQYQHLLVAGDKYGLERMKLVCQEKLCRYIRADSVATMLALADRHHCPGLKEACFDFLSSSTNLSLFTETDGFEVLSEGCPAVLKELLAKLATVLIFE